METLFEGNFIHDFIDEDLGADVYDHVHTRFPPEPNGYLHIGHCKALCIDFGTALKYGGQCNLRFDDTNPAKEDVEYVDAIMRDIKWMGFDWEDRLYYGSDYFDETHAHAVKLIEQGLAYVCQLSPEAFKEKRGDLKRPAESPWRDRPIDESLRLFEEMRQGKHPEGSMTLRAKIDLASGNFNMRDPALYRIRFIDHHRQGSKYCLFPMYDFAHPLQDAMEGITHSLCSLEYEDHRPLYDWVIDHCDIGPVRPRQIEFARMKITHTVLSKRKLRRLVEEQFVSGWDDPRMPTLGGLRRRGYTPAAIRSFIERAGVAKVSSTVEMAFLEHCIREDLNASAPRVMAVLDPIKLVLTNYPEDKTELFDIENNPARPEDGTRAVTFSRELWIEGEDFSADPPPKYNRLIDGGEVRLKGAYIVRATGFETDAHGKVTTVLAEVDFDSRGGNAADGRKVKGTIHWADAGTAVTATVNVYDTLFLDPDPDAADKDFLSCMNPDSLKTLEGCKVERSLAGAKPGDTFQFMRLGYFCADVDSTAETLIFNRTVTLKDSFAKQTKK